MESHEKYVMFVTQITNVKNGLGKILMCSSTNGDDKNFPTFPSKTTENSEKCFIELIMLIS